MALAKKLITLEKELIEKVQAIADQSHRSWSAQALWLIEKGIEAEANDSGTVELLRAYEKLQEAYEKLNQPLET